MKFCCTDTLAMYSEFCLSAGELCETFPQQAWLRPIIGDLYHFIPMISLLNMAFPLRGYDYGRVRFLLLQIFFCLQICN